MSPKPSHNIPNPLNEQAEYIMESVEFEQHRSYLFAIAYRMLSSVNDAEDIVQEAYLRWQQTSPQGVLSLRSYLSTVVTRLCIEHLRKAYVRREMYVGPWLPEPLLTETVDLPPSQSELIDSLSTAFLLLLEKLSPTERAVFLLHNIFDYSYDEISNILEKTPEYCRQIAKRAKQHLHDHRPRFSTTEQEKSALIEQFMEACISGDLSGLMALFSPNVIFYSDGGGKRKSARRPIIGAHKVARFILGILRKTPLDFDIQLTSINGDIGLIQHKQGIPISALTFSIQDHQIHGLYSVVNPDKLARLDRTYQVFIERISNDLFFKNIIEV